jgi:hypothetical protein
MGEEQGPRQRASRGRQRSSNISLRRREPSSSNFFNRRSIPILSLSADGIFLLSPSIRVLAGGGELMES